MEKIKKFLLKLSPGERQKVEEILQHIAGGNLEQLNVKKLKGYKDVFRVRFGSIRIIFAIRSMKRKIIDVSRRNDSTYRDL